MKMKNSLNFRTLKFSLNQLERNISLLRKWLRNYGFEIQIDVQHVSRLRLSLKTKNVLVKVVGVKRISNEL